VAEELVLEPVVEEFVVADSIVVVEEFEAGIGVVGVVVVEDGSVAITNSAPIAVVPVESVSVKKNLLSGIAGAGVQVKEVESILAAFHQLCWPVLFLWNRVSYPQLC
jgi:hypothetical protein